MALILDGGVVGMGGRGLVVLRRFEFVELVVLNESARRGIAVGWLKMVMVMADRRVGRRFGMYIRV